MLRTRLLLFLILFSLLSVGGISLANWGLQSKQDQVKEEVEGMQDISGVPRVINMSPVSVLVADEYEYILSVVDSDTPVSEIQLTIESAPAWIRAVGMRIYGTPSAQDIGTHQVVYSLNDGSNSITNSFYIVVSENE